MIASDSASTALLSRRVLAKFLLERGSDLLSRLSSHGLGHTSPVPGDYAANKKGRERSGRLRHQSLATAASLSIREKVVPRFKTSMPARLRGLRQLLQQGGGTAEYETRKPQLSRV